MPATILVRRSDDALKYDSQTEDGRTAVGVIPSKMGAKIVASAVFLDLGIVDSITDKHREYTPSFVIPVRKEAPKETAPLQETASLPCSTSTTATMVFSGNTAEAKFSGISVSPNTCTWIWDKNTTSVVPANATITSSSRVGDTVTVGVDVTNIPIGDTVYVIIVLTCDCSGNTAIDTHQARGTK